MSSTNDQHTVASDGSPQDVESESESEVNSTDHMTDQMSDQTTDVSASPDEGDLARMAQNAAAGDEVALDHFFAAIGGAAWGLAFVSTESVSQGVQAVAQGISRTLLPLRDEASGDDIRVDTLRNVRNVGNELSSPDTSDGADLASDRGEHIDEPVSLLGETQDRQATLALTALDEPQRVALWLTGAEHFGAERAGKVLGKSADEVSHLVDEAQVSFRKYYLDATRREDLDAECVMALNNLGDYVDRSLDTDGIAATELHLVNCAHCRGVVIRISELSPRLRAAIPPVPTITRQRVTEAWSDTSVTAPVITLPATSSTKDHRGGMIAATAAAVVFALLLSGTLIATKQQSTRLASSGNEVTTTAPAPDATTSTPAGAPTTVEDTTSITPNTPPSTASPEGESSASTPDAAKANVSVTPVPTTASVSAGSADSSRNSSGSTNPKKSTPPTKSASAAASTAKKPLTTSTTKPQPNPATEIITETVTVTEIITTTKCLIPEGQPLDCP